jgi:hypothetical protein
VWDVMLSFYPQSLVSRSPPFNALYRSHISCIYYVSVRVSCMFVRTIIHVDVY